MIALARRLAASGVLGINRRNAEYTLVYNPRRRYPLVDDKLLTKTLAQQAGINVPQTYAVVEIQRQVRDLAHVLREHRDFVVKPAHGSQGDGILVVTGRSRDAYRIADGALLREDELLFHVSNILSGIYSLGGHPDKAVVEYRVNFDPVFERVTYRGVPDVRVIVFLGVPVMAMVRLPTRRSGGKANLHQGAIGAGVDMDSGRTLSAVMGAAVIDEHPDTGNPVAGVEIPHWNRILETASRCYEITGLGYQGIDMVLDRERGPMILELNARPGLAIQIANRSGLRERLEAVRARHAALASVEERVAYARSAFGAG